MLVGCQFPDGPNPTSQIFHQLILHLSTQLALHPLHQRLGRKLVVLLEELLLKGGGEAVQGQKATQQQEALRGIRGVHLGMGGSWPAAVTAAMSPNSWRNDKRSVLSSGTRCSRPWPLGPPSSLEGLGWNSDSNHPKTEMVDAWYWSKPSNILKRNVGSTFCWVNCWGRWGAIGLARNDDAPNHHGHPRQPHNDRFETNQLRPINPCSNRVVSVHALKVSACSKPPLSGRVASWSSCPTSARRRRHTSGPEGCGKLELQLPVPHLVEKIINITCIQSSIFLYRVTFDVPEIDNIN